ncbi:GNAT family N-acetyltransferase [Kitasatospora atroaurantiaca]|uniref:Acetyltransferase (GNAT) family protein n=1 Tax=Kitasatospora atroaurantiaca TaxID=285545 RepID=A0A561EZB5_9ACTN|nr:GNAT family N-acetyltransferase [Kitasatospora atroaurantiaca]TWE20951.1 acetyltransferase (GNAT) family protein [Kitasatospora atroaurantiaca]
MTTTLRPERPEEPLPGGGRSRRWQICVNGRPVGGLRTTALPRGSQWWGEISELEVAEGRRRGRATVGALAAEEVLRGWDCSRVDVSIPAEATAALGLAEALGYTERMRNMAKHLTRLPDLPTGLTVRQIGAADYEDWLEAAKAGYLHDLCASGLTEAQARAKSDADHVHVLPQGHATPGVALRRIHDAQGTPLGSLWVALQQSVLPSGAPLAWVMTVEVAPAQRGRGIGRALMLLAERECLVAGVQDLGLNVFSSNTIAIRLYESLGYGVTQRVLGKSLL